MTRLASGFAIAAGLVLGLALRAASLPDMDQVTLFRAIVPDYSRTSGGRSPALSPDGKTLTSLDWWGEVYILPGVSLSDEVNDQPWRLKLPKPDAECIPNSGYRQGRPRNLDWSRDGSKLALGYNDGRLYISEKVDGLRKPDIYPIVERQTTLGGMILVGNPRWSPDGTRIAFTRHCPAMLNEWVQICVVDVRTRKELVLGRYEGARMRDLEVLGQPWSPDGRRLVIPGERSGLCIVSPDGKERRAILGGRVSCPSWSSADGRIAYVGPVADTANGVQTLAVWVTDRDGAHARCVSRPTNERSRAAIARMRAESARLSRSPIRRRVEDPLAGLQAPAGIEGDTDPVWSPDGGRLAFVRRGGKQDVLYVLDLSGGTARRVFTSGEVSCVNWMRDSVSLVIESKRIVAMHPEIATSVQSAYGGLSTDVDITTQTVASSAYPEVWIVSVPKPAAGRGKDVPTDVHAGLRDPAHGPVSPRLGDLLDPETRVYVVPNMVKLNPGARQRFRVFAADIDEREMEVHGSVKWEADPGAGTMGTDGLFVAGKKTGCFPRSVRVTIDGRYQASAVVTVIPRTPVGGYSLEKAWGGRTESYLREPVGITVDSHGDVYVADRGYSRVQKFSADGRYIAQWGSYGGGPSQFGNIHAVAAGNGGRIFTADGNAGIPLRAFDENGRYLDRWDDGPMPNGWWINTPGILAPAADGGLYVGDSGGMKHIIKFDPSWKPVAQWTPLTDSGAPVDFQAIAVDAQGNVYLGSNDSYPVRKLDRSGACLAKWEGKIAGNDRLYRVSGIAVGRDGYVYVADPNKERVVKLDPEGRCVATWGSRGLREGQFFGIGGIAVGPNGCVYAIDKHADRVQQFDAQGRFLRQWGSVGDRHGMPCIQGGMAVDRAGNLRIAGSYPYCMQTLDPDGTVLKRVPAYSRTNWSWGALANCSFWDADFDSAGSMYALRPSNLDTYIAKYNPEGIFVAEWGTKGDGDGQFTLASDIAVDASGHVYVLDSRAGRIQEFDSSGRYLSQWRPAVPTDGQPLAPTAMAIGPTGCFYLSEQAWARIAKYDSAGKPIKEWGGRGKEPGQFELPMDIAVDARGNVYVADSDGRCVKKFDSDGRYITEIQTGDMLPMRLAVTPSGAIYVATHLGDELRKYVPVSK